MTPRQAILDLLRKRPETLLRLIRMLGLLAADSEPTETSEELLALLDTCPEATNSWIRSLLDEEELRMVAANCGLLTRGSAEELRDRIGFRSAFEEPSSGPRRRARAPRNLGPTWHYQGEPFVAIDFETADRKRDSACSVALVRVEEGEIRRTETRLIRPPRKRFEFTHIHGLTWQMVQDAGSFEEVWPELEEILDGVDFLVAHNAPFDRGVLEACCREAGLLAPSLPFHCTVRLARQTWKLRRARLPDVCGLLGIPLQHHDATSDAQACARIVLESWRARLRAGL